MANKIEPSVEKMIETLKTNPSARFSKSDFQGLIYAVLADKDFNAKKYVLKNDELVTEDVNINAAMAKFMDKLLKHAGMNDSAERDAVIETFEFGVRDVEWIMDAVDEAQWLYTECGKNLRMFRDQVLQLSVKKMERSGGKGTTYKKSVANRMVALQKRKKN